MMRSQRPGGVKSKLGRTVAGLMFVLFPRV